MASTEVRAKEANIQITVNGQRLGGSFSTVHDLTVKPDVQLDKKRFPGQQRAVGDLDIKGYDFSFKHEKRDHSWATLWKLYEDASDNGTPFPEVSLTVTYSYRDGVGAVRTKTLHGDLVLKLDDDSVPKDGYLGGSWTGFCAYWT